MIVITALNIVVVIMAYLARLEKYRFLLAWAFILLALVLGIRYDYGNDYQAYYDIFYGKNGEEKEIGWEFLCTFFRPIGFICFVLLLTIFEHILLYMQIKKHVQPNYFWIALFIYLFTNSYMLIGLSMMRQFLVMVMGFYLLELSYNRKRILFFCVLIVAILIHSMAFLMVLLYFIPSIQLFISKHGKLSVIASFFLFVTIFVYMGSFLSSLIDILSGTDNKYVSDYIGESLLFEENPLGVKNVIKWVTVVFLLIRNYPRLTDQEKMYPCAMILGYFIIPFYIYIGMAIRASWLFTIFEIFSIPFLLSREKVVLIKYGSIILLCFLTLYDYRNFFYSDIYGNYFIIYKTIFSI